MSAGQEYQCTAVWLMPIRWLQMLTQQLDGCKAKLTKQHQEKGEKINLDIAMYQIWTKIRQWY